MTPEIMKVRCPQCGSPDESVELYGPDPYPELLGSCTVCQHVFDESMVVHLYVRQTLRSRRRQQQQSRAQKILDGFANLFKPEYGGGREIL
jgi:uncharacterized Zn finger protein